MSPTRMEHQTLEGALSLRVVGELDHEGALQVEDALLRAVDGASRAVILDLSGCPFVASQGIRLLLEARKRLAARGLGMSLTGLVEQVRAVFDLTGVLEIIPERPV